jgi:hypothetical protein
MQTQFSDDLANALRDTSDTKQSATEAAKRLSELARRLQLYECPDHWLAALLQRDDLAKERAAAQDLIERQRTKELIAAYEPDYDQLTANDRDLDKPFILRSFPSSECFGPLTGTFNSTGQKP